MTLFGISAATVLAWLLALAFLGAGIVNAAGSAAIRDDFVRWGYPRWWNRVTGGLEVLVAALIAMPAARDAGLLLGAAICVAAVATVVRCKDYGHVAPGAVLTALSALDLVLFMG
jgi:Mn2+/Fe2+ NRAMP family transporter